MDSEGKFWVSVWATVATCFCTLVVTIGANCYASNRMKAEAIAKGADPLAVACAYDGAGQMPSCAVLAAKSFTK